MGLGFRTVIGLAELRMEWVLAAHCCRSLRGCPCPVGMLPSSTGFCGLFAAASLAGMLLDSEVLFLMGNEGKLCFIVGC